MKRFYDDRSLADYASGTLQCLGQYAPQTVLPFLQHEFRSANRSHWFQAANALIDLDEMPPEPEAGGNQ